MELTDLFVSIPLAELSLQQKEETAYRIEILFHEVYYVENPFHDKSAAYGFLNLAIAFFAEVCGKRFAAEHQDYLNWENYAPKSALLHVANKTGFAFPSHLFPTAQELEHASSRVQEVFAASKVKRCSYLYYEDPDLGRKNKKNSHLSDYGIAPAKLSDKLLTKQRRKHAFALYVKGDESPRASAKKPKSAEFVPDGFDSDSDAASSTDSAHYALSSEAVADPSICASERSEPGYIVTEPDDVEDSSVDENQGGATSSSTQHEQPCQAAQQKTPNQVAISPPLRARVKANAPAKRARLSTSVHTVRTLSNSDAFAQKWHEWRSPIRKVQLFSLDDNQGASGGAGTIPQHTNSVPGAGTSDVNNVTVRKATLTRPSAPKKMKCMHHPESRPPLAWDQKREPPVESVTIQKKFKAAESPAGLRSASTIHMLDLELSQDEGRLKLASGLDDIQKAERQPDFLKARESVRKLQSIKDNLSSTLNDIGSDYASILQTVNHSIAAVGGFLEYAQDLSKIRPAFSELGTINAQLKTVSSFASRVSQAMLSLSIFARRVNRQANTCGAMKRKVDDVRSGVTSTVIGACCPVYLKQLIAFEILIMEVALGYISGNQYSLLNPTLPLKVSRPSLPPIPEGVTPYLDIFAQMVTSAATILYNHNCSEQGFLELNAYFASMKAIG